ncbi:AAA family ATPase [Altererythrobacter sp. GH1-8]|uniref:AAA family ATPase n=1 Tax=Altererythrobacter sp. GH1-8 TaxID=3349333 RepID=UPI00374D9866
MTDHPGATPEEWAHWDLGLELADRLMPTVSNQQAKISPQSKMNDIGKTPSWYNGSGHVAGIPEWSDRKPPTGKELQRWAENGDYGICLRTGMPEAIGAKINLVAIDLDSEDGKQVATAKRIARKHLGDLPMRSRHGSMRELLLVQVEGPPIRRRIVHIEGGERLEILATGQHCVVAGTHPKGARYEWPGGLPTEIPIVSAEQFEAFFAELQDTMGVEPPSMAGERRRGERLDIDDPRMDWIEENWECHGYGRDGQVFITCPFEDGHSSGEAGDTSTAYFPAGTNGYERGHYACLHASCLGRGDADFDEATGYAEAELEQRARTDLEDLTEFSDAIFSDQLRPKFEFVSSRDFLARPRPGYLIKGVLPRRGVSIIYGDPGAGKSFFALDIAASLAMGETWQGRKVKKANVAYVCAEGAGGFRDRIEAIERVRGPLGDNFKILAATPNLLDEAQAKDLRRAAVLAVQGEPSEDPVGSVIFIDTLAQVTAGGDENSSVDMGKAISVCQAIAEETGGLVVLIHHTGKDASRGARGWSGLTGAADNMIRVLKGPTCREAHITKMKDGPDGGRFGFELKPIDIGIDEDGDLIESCVLIEAELSGPQVKISGKWQIAVWQAANDLAGLDGRAAVEDMILRAMEKFPRETREGKRDHRRQNLKRALDDLCAKGHLRADNDHVIMPGGVANHTPLPSSTSGDPTTPHP